MSAASPDSRRRRRWRWLIGTLVLVVALALIAIQIGLPLLAERRIEDQLAQRATGVEVDVDALPAWTLLDGRADAVRVHLKELTSTRGDAGDLLASTRRTEKLDARVDVIERLGIRLRDLRLRKRGAVLRAEAGIARADVAAILPPAIRIDPDALARRELAFTARASAFGQDLSGTLGVRAREGRIVLGPELPIVNLDVTLWEDRRVVVTGVGVRVRGEDYVAWATGRLRP